MPASNSANTSERIKTLAADLGFALCGLADARPTDHRRHVVEWLASGQHGEMKWLADHLDVRVDPEVLLPGARSVICIADHIGPPPPDQSAIRNPRSAIGRVARYAQVDDYHKVLKRRLHKLADALRAEHPAHQFRVCVDTAPLLEREHAHRAGIGWVGKNTLLIHPSRGSHLLLGEIVTTLDLTPDEPEPDHCGTCTRCIDACPTDCITPYSVDASRCISYLTIEHRGRIDPALHEAIGDWLYGCDVCQDVCPYNAPDRGSVSTPPPPDYGEARPATMDLLNVLDWNEDARRAAFVRSAMKRAKLEQMKRNAVIVAGNRISAATLTDDANAGELRRRIERIASDAAESDIVRHAANAVLNRISRSSD